MQLAGQGNGDPARARERGYAMAALLVGMSIMAVLMAAALPSWTHMAQREKEEEYLFRAKQYARAIMLYNVKMQAANQMAPSVDFLIEQRFLRKKYKDPITGDDFALVRVVTGAPPGFGQPQPGQKPQPGQSGQIGQSGQTGQMGQTGQAGQTGQPGQAAKGPENGPFIGVKSKSKAQAIKLFKGQQTTYDQWEITMLDVQNAMARGATGAAGAINSGVNPAGRASPFGAGSGQATPMAPGGGFGQPAQPPTGSPFGQPSQPSPGGNQPAPKFPPFPSSTTGTNPFQQAPPKPPPQ